MSRFLVVEKVRGNLPMATPDSPEGERMAKLFQEDLEYKIRLKRQRKLVGGGPFLDILADCYILDVKSVEEAGEIFFNSPTNLLVDREVHPLGTFEDTLEGLKEISQASRRSRRK